MKTFLLKIREFVSLKWYGKGVVVSSGLLFLVLVTVFSVYAFEEEPVNTVSAVTVPMEEEVKSPRTLFPTLLEESSSTLIGTILSHETASVYPRRDGVIQDILVDIGDRVQKNQVIARMLPPGVEGESAGMIAERRAMVNRGESDVKNADAVARATIQSAEQELAQKKVQLENAYKIRGVVLNQSGTVLKTTINNEEAKISAAEQKVEVASTRITQMLGFSQVAVSSSRRVVETIFTATQNGIDYSLAKQLRNTLFTDLNELKRGEESSVGSDVARQKEHLFDLFSQANRLLSTGQELMKGVLPTTEEGRQDILEYTRDLIEAQDKLLMARKNLEDAFNDLIVAQRNLKTMESEQQKMVDMSQREYETTKTMQRSDLDNLHEEIAVLEKKLDLMKADQQKMVDREKSELGVYRAVLQQEYAKSGNQEIRSPFAGVVSKRMLQVGEMANPSMPAFELVEVQTTLSRKAKREIQFGLPEHSPFSITLGSEVEFFLPTDPDSVYKAVVTRMSPQIDFGSKTFTVQARLDDALVFPHNTSVRVRLSSGNGSQAFRIPSQSILREGEKNFVWIGSSLEAEPERILITVLAEDGEFAEIMGNIDEKTLLYIDPPMKKELDSSAEGLMEPGNGQASETNG